MPVHGLAIRVSIKEDGMVSTVPGLRRIWAAAAAGQVYVVMNSGGMIVLRETADQPGPSTPPAIYLPMALTHARNASCDQCEARQSGEPLAAGMLSCGILMAGAEASGPR